ncbi:hypothetical protein PN451_02590 [Dolichospermum planctonicum CS-1226]|uniref:Uncharacterized protein n=1 Tax=Dolichospermum planctonicum CS-1226 TaxID=3021751 RepID=A0ABT5ABU9_9CYAN|nr:hypothetical protein [Dolichospermum planctonicum]MDB9534743.1 hypothetical protein [Dolichospermum planctonicum CS-1226]
METKTLENIGVESSTAELFSSLRGKAQYFEDTAVPDLMKYRY